MSDNTAKKSGSLPERVLKILMDASRLSAVRSKRIKKGVNQADFDEISSMAALVFKAPVAQVTFLEDKTQYFQSTLGFDISESPTETSFCAFTIASTEQITVSLDTTVDKRFSNNPFVTHPPNIRFYAGCPIVVNEQKVGTICLYDFEPRVEVTGEQAEVLLELAQKAGDLFESR